MAHRFGISLSIAAAGPFIDQKSPMQSESSAVARSFRHAAAGWRRELMSRQPLLTGFAWLMLALAVPTAFLLAFDDRSWRDVAIWAKALKFMLSTAMFAATTAWFVGLLPRTMQRSSMVRGLVACSATRYSSP